MQRKVILVIENATDITGSLNSILRSSLYLRDRFQFLFILPTGSKASKFISREGFQVFEFPMAEIRKTVPALMEYVPKLVSNARRLSEFVAHHKVDLILNNDFYNLLPAALCFIGRNVPYVCYVRFLPSRFPKMLVRFWYGAHRRYATGIIAVSEAVRRELPSNEKVVVIGNELPLTSKPFSASHSRLILYPSNFIEGKGHNYALRAFALAANHIKGWKIRFIGSDMGLEKNARFRRSLVELGTSLGISNQVEWLDFDDRVVDHYNEAALVLNFSESESFSMTCLEAMFYGRPVIATRCGGPEEIIDDQVNGLLVNNKDIEAMRHAIEKLVEDSSLRNVMSSNAYHDVRSKFSAANTIEKLANLYQSSLLK